MRIVRYVEDCLLSFLQGRCDHPGEMVAADLLDGCADGIQVKYCRRCGSIKTDWSPSEPTHRYISLEHFWRRPDPHLWSGALLVASVLMLAGSAFAQVVPTQPQAQRLDAATGVQSVAAAVGGQQTLTIPALAGFYVYVTMIDAAACQDGTASLTDLNKAWTTTNLGGLTFETSVLAAATITSNPGDNLCDRHIIPFPTTLKSTTAGVAVTIVSPSSNAHVAYPMLVTYYYGL